MSTRNGKIARLPARIRNQLNQRLDDGAEGPELLDWLNALPEVHQVMQAQFNGAPVNKQNLSEWRMGGFQEWLLRRDLYAQSQDVAESFEEIGRCAPDAKMIDGVAVALAARFGILLVHWNGEVDEKVEAKGRFLNAVCRSVVRLQRSTHQANLDRFEERRLLREEEEKAVKPGETVNPPENTPQSQAKPLTSNRMQENSDLPADPGPVAPVKPNQTVIPMRDIIDSADKADLRIALDALAARGAAGQI